MAQVEPEKAKGYQFPPQKVNQIKFQFFIKSVIINE